MKIAFEIDDDDIRGCLESISGFIAETGITFEELQGMLLSLIMKRQAKQAKMSDAAKHARKAKAKAKVKPKPKAKS